MKKIYLCGHTGSANRGCEAIVRSTVKILRECGVDDIALLTFNDRDDRVRGIDKIVELIPYPKKTVIDRGMSLVARKLFKNGVWGKREIMPKDVFGVGTKAIFEGIEVMIPEKYDEYLTRLYGDYMTPPPPEKRVGHHYYEIADKENSYINVWYLK